MTVEFEPPNAQHLIRFFFDRLVFSREWMRRHLDRTIHDLQARYSPGEHIDTESLMPFDVIYRRENICRDLRAIFDAARSSNLRAAADLVEGADALEREILVAENLLMDFQTLDEAVDWTIAKVWPICSS